MPPARATIQIAGFLEMVQGGVVILAFARVDNAEAQCPIQLGCRQRRFLR